MVPTTRIPVVNLELIRAYIPTLGRDVYIRLRPTGFGRPSVTHDILTNRMASRRRCFIQISALSTFDGRIEAYHGGNG